MRQLKGSTRIERILFGNLPDAYPVNHPVDGSQQVPVLRRVNVTDIPDELVAFDDRKRAKSPTHAGLHFFRDDKKFISILVKPEAKTMEFAPYKIMLTPDVTIGDGMPPWQKARNVVLGRAAGVVWEKRGMKVIPTVRWTNQEDLDLVTCGIPQRSVFAVSSYMARRDPTDYSIFQEGLRYLVNCLNPVAVIVYGSLDDELSNELSRFCDIFVYQDPMTKIRDNAKRVSPDDNALFPH
ncbi:MAG: DUF4417 domain-containing protein [Actinobacteria bacterium]|nr:DUF4417 domain-containing protein [Actinomycetota bacterium]